MFYRAAQSLPPPPLPQYLLFLKCIYSGSKIRHQICFEVGVVKLAEFIINVILEVHFGKGALQNT